MNRLLDESAYRIAALLNGMGHPSIFTPRDGYGNLEVLTGPAPGVLLPSPCRVPGRTGYVRSQ